ncbi:MAG: hypothetical protein EPN37_07210 [Chitinophagaceae bacterium]|nr:MAG: hypothetical protein EPN37_07210 [Chitinophagaceae bacterium]
MLVLKDNPTGIDQPIQRLQSWLYPRLKTVWNIGDNEWMSYGRVYKNQDVKGYIPEVYVGGNEYKEVFFDDNYPVISFLGMEDKRQIDVSDNAQAYIIFQVDLSVLKPAIGHRGDEEVHMDVLNQFKTPVFGFKLSGIETGIENVFSEFRLYKRHTGQMTNTESIKYRDMHPLHCFKVTFNLKYKNNNC